MIHYLILYWDFFKIGLFAIGGGLATLPFLFKLAEATGRYSAHLNPDMIPNVLAVAQSIPGGIGANMATYVGFICGGIPGGVVAVLGLSSPSVIIILIIARMVKAFKESRTFKAVFSGIRPAAAGLLTAAGFSAIKLSLYNPAVAEWLGRFKWKECLLFIVLFLINHRFKGHPIIYIAIAGVIGVIFKF